MLKQQDRTCIVCIVWIIDAAMLHSTGTFSIGASNDHGFLWIFLGVGNALFVLLREFALQFVYPRPYVGVTPRRLHWTLQDEH